jgi:N-acetyl sugar amidotransferase
MQKSVEAGQTAGHNRVQTKTTAREPWAEEWTDRINRVKVRCGRCLYDETVPNISFDAKGVCNYCKTHDQLEKDYPAGDEGHRKLKQIAEQIKRENRKKEFNVIVGVSGGCDSSYLVYLAKELGLRPLAVHYDNTWDSTIAVENISNVLKKLDVELYTYVVDNEEYDDIYRSFFKAGVPDLEIPTDLGLATVLNMAAQKYGIRYILEGHSFRTEGLFPLGWLYMDARYVESVQKQYGTMPLQSFPNLWLSSQLRWMIVNRIKKIRPLWYMTYHKAEVKQLLTREVGWKSYGGHHLENRITTFFHTYFMPRRFQVDERMVEYSALIRSGQMEREEALKMIHTPPEFDPELIVMVKKRLGFTDDEFEHYMTMPKKSFRDFKTYKPLFEQMRPFFWLMAKMDLIPMSFYIKYTSKNNI